MATDRIYGDWEARIADRARSIDWWDLVRTLLLLALLAGTTIAALFGFG